MISSKIKVDMFKNVLLEALEAEMDETLGYQKSDPAEKETTNRRNKP